ncbi:MAG: 2-hydroxyacyl-CoA dehydratase [Oscillibacter sp.]|nr:2-hydroxyacyl-CoA dehydratase [Oscillibacter sp.]
MAYFRSNRRGTAAEEEKAAAPGTKNAGESIERGGEPNTTRFIYDYLGLHRPRDFAWKIQLVLDREFPGIPHPEVKRAVQAAYEEYYRHMEQVRREGARIINTARAQGRRIIVLAGRPYHVDPEVNHGIDELIVRSGAAVVTEDAVSQYAKPFRTSVLNQWTYHARLYAAAKYCTEQPDMDLVHLVSFGCGVDAITSDETREILRAGDKLYTQLKIDEITNLGAVRIRLRSLFAALDEHDQKLAARGVTAADAAAADAFAREQQYDGAAYRGQWNGWQVYEPLLRDADSAADTGTEKRERTLDTGTERRKRTADTGTEKPERAAGVVGLPLVLLARDGRVHLSSAEEAMACLRGAEGVPDAGEAEAVFMSKEA